MKVCVSKYFSSSSIDLKVPEELFRQLRRADDFIRLAVVAANSVLARSNCTKGVPYHRTGLFLGTAFGPMQTNFKVLDQVVEREPVSPTLFSNSVFNGGAGYIASVLDIRGCAVTVTDFDFPFFRAVRQGMLAIESGRLDRCLVLQVETYSDLLLDARMSHNPSGEEWVPGVACWLLERPVGNTEVCRALEHLKIVPEIDANQSWFELHEEVTLAANCVGTDGFLGAAIWLTERLAEKDPELFGTCVINSLYGRVELGIGS